MGVDDPFDCGQPQAEPLIFSGALAPVKDLEDMRHVLWRYTGPLVVDGKPYLAIVSLDLQKHRGLRRGIFDGISQQVLQNPPEQERISLQHEKLRRELGC